MKLSEGEKIIVIGSLLFLLSIGMMIFVLEKDNNEYDRVCLKKVSVVAMGQCDRRLWWCYYLWSDGSRTRENVDYDNGYEKCLQVIKFKKAK